MFDVLSRLVRSFRKSSAKKSQRQRHRRLSLEALDPRLLMSVTPTETVKAQVMPVMVGPVSPSPQQLDQQMGLPRLDSLPGAPATLYLDFDGNSLSSWSTGGQTFTNVSTPVWDMDGNTNKFSSAEQAVIKEVWARVAEDYAPFNINVSTDYYGSFNNGQALQVCIGGSNNDWLKADASGISSIGSFHDSQPNVVFAFDMVAWANAGVQDSEGRPMNGPEAMATTISHEAGHSFGLLHHSTYDSNGHRVDEYDPGSSNWTPIMGNNKADDRTTWAYLPTDQGVNDWQDDMAQIAAPLNGFGYRPDDHGNTPGNADPLVHSGVGASITSPLTGSGIINQPTDKDFFKFTAPGGTFQIEVDSAMYGPNLLPVVQLWSSNGVLANASYATPTRTGLTANLPAGDTFYVRVSSVGDYGDVGQYSVSLIPTVATQTRATQTTYANTYLASASESAAAPSSSVAAPTTYVASAGNGQNLTTADATQQHLSSPITPIVAPVTAPVAKLVVGSLGSPATPQHNTNVLRPAIVDAIHALDRPG